LWTTGFSSLDLFLVTGGSMPWLLPALPALWDAMGPLDVLDATKAMSMGQELAGVKQNYTTCLQNSSIL